MDRATLERELAALIKELSYREGDFTLASGLKSNHYIDLKATTLHPKGASLIGKLTVEVLKGEEVTGVGGMTLGADPIATSVSLAALDAGLHWPAYIVRKEPKKHGTSRYVEGVENLKKDAPLVLLEDVVTTGMTSLKAVDYLREEGFNPTVFLTVVDREQGGMEALAKAGLRSVALVTLEQIRSS